MARIRSDRIPALSFNASQVLHALAGYSTARGRFRAEPRMVFRQACWDVTWITLADVAAALTELETTGVIRREFGPERDPYGDTPLQMGQFESRVLQHRQQIPAAVRSLLVQRDGDLCRHCGSGEDIEVDHIHPVALGGTDEALNLQLLCRRCNRAKRDQPAVWYWQQTERCGADGRCEVCR